jgi:hypothetical protein
LKREGSTLADSIAITAIAAIPKPIMLTALMVPSARDLTGNLIQAWIIGA